MTVNYWVVFSRTSNMFVVKFIIFNAYLNKHYMIIFKRVPRTGLYQNVIDKEELIGKL